MASVISKVTERLYINGFQVANVNIKSEINKHYQADFMNFSTFRFARSSTFVSNDPR